MITRLIFGVFVFVAFAGISASGQRTITLQELREMKKKDSPADTSKPVTDQPAKMTASKTHYIADGSYSKIRTPFAFVARDRKTYQILGSMFDGFENDKNIDFDKHAVVAAFSGAKETGGYSVSIGMKDGKCVIEDIAPAHGAIVTEAITYPFAVALVPVEEQAPLEIIADETWGRLIEMYDLVAGDFEFTGGIVGMTKKFGVDGSVGVMRNGRHITLFFKLSEKGESQTRRLFETGSGLLNEKMPELMRLEAGDLIDRPHPPFKVDVEFDGNKVEMKFTPGERDYVVNDGFEGKGTLTAVKRSVN